MEDGFTLSQRTRGVPTVYAADTRQEILRQVGDRDDRYQKSGYFSKNKSGYLTAWRTASRHGTAENA